MPVPDGYPPLVGVRTNMLMLRYVGTLSRANCPAGPPERCACTDPTGRRVMHRAAPAECPIGDHPTVEILIAVPVERTRAHYGARRLFTCPICRVVVEEQLLPERGAKREVA